MPHKHRLPSSSKRASNYDLPPSTLAQPLSVAKAKTKTTTSRPPAPRTNFKASNSKHTAHTVAKVTQSQIKPEKSKRKRKDIDDDDTPRAFTRLLSKYHPPPRSGLDDGAPRPSKKAKITSKSSKPMAIKVTNPTDVPIPRATSSTKPTILPGESLRDYSFRVDAAIPVTGLTAKGRKVRDTAGELKGLKGLEQRQTKTERKMQRMQQQWREEDARRKRKREEAREDAEDIESGDEFPATSKSKKGKKAGRKGNDGGTDESEGDIWASIAAKRSEMEAAGGGLVGVHDVVLAPPKLIKTPREKFKMSSGKGLGLKRQAEISEARMEVVEGYRALMRAKNADGGSK
ncbi:hypothetical protein G7Y79_00027g061130 [Physcia stellaris]|nr:hypothetical protein G7Y79_00027g061130 [Physcia stellaris]